ncbi:tRNA pseudouridine(55) synthase TruB [Luteitalea sp.]|uniref:tRNA pseudouridine(55) synthase TruB n=1 Tax=Luteitalea sp. TaxID=2004800 RepID=UPI0025C1620E|nr:tRNA pseudouridine(55) synthase TruB [Luteitalea sp.]
MSSGIDGVLVVDKPEGMTSHDVVATVRRRLPRKTKVGHTGTLDPFATGVLPVVIGKATRLSQFLTAGRKRYRATVAFGVATDSGDRMGQIVETAAPERLAVLDEALVRTALTGFVGTHPQVPPAHSAKMIDGERAYVLARRGERVEMAAVAVTAHALTLTAWDAASHVATVALDVSAGYYVRSLARDLGVAVGVPAHLTALCRTGSSDWTIEDAHALGAVVQADPEAFAAMCRPMSTVLREWPAVVLTERQVAWVLAGRLVALEPAQASRLGAATVDRARLLDASGTLVALARHTPDGLLHADVVLG